MTPDQLARNLYNSADKLADVGSLNGQLVRVAQPAIRERAKRRTGALQDSIVGDELAGTVEALADHASVQRNDFIGEGLSDVFPQVEAITEAHAQRAIDAIAG